MDTSSMKSWLTMPVIIIGLVVILALTMMGKYNSLVRSSAGVDTQWAQVETQYQRRLDLIPNLVASVQGAMKQETAVFTALADARSKYAGANTPDTKAAAAGQVESAFGRLLAIMENYPQLKSIDTVQSLMAELAGTENRVSVERMRYNDIVKDYNISVSTFPGSFVASMFGFKPRTLFTADAGAAQAPKVNL